MDTCLSKELRFFLLNQNKVSNMFLKSKLWIEELSTISSLHDGFLRLLLKISGDVYEQNLQHYLGLNSTGKSFTKEAIRNPRSTSGINKTLMVNGSRNTVIYIYSLLEFFNSIIPKHSSAKTHKGILQKEEKPRLANLWSHLLTASYKASRS